MPFLISYPRSGQHLTSSILQKVLFAHSLPFSYCNYYRCCNQIPCRHRCIYQKNHDFNNKLQICSDQKYIVLYRKDSIRQLEAFYRFHIKERNETTYNVEDACQFYLDRIDKYNAFISKWVNIQRSNVLPIEYYDLCADPFTTIMSMLHFLYPTTIFNESLVQSILTMEFNVFDGLHHSNTSTIKIQNHLSDEKYNELVEIIEKKKLQFLQK